MTEEFAAAPKVVRPKNKYKEPQPQENQQQQIKLIYNNLMWDKRVFRGNTHAALVTLKNVDNTQQAGQTRGGNQNQNQQPVQLEDNSNRRANIQIFTDQFVQTLTDKPPRYQYASQTDALPQKPVIRHRIPQRQNIVDIQTQIWDNQLFDFDYEVQPLLNVLCGRVLQVSRMEVLQQEELNVMRNRQEQLSLEEKAEKEKINKMYEQENNLEMQNAKKIQIFRKQKDKKIKTHKRLFSRVLSKDFLKNISVNALEIVQRNGFFRDPLQNRIMTQVPALFYQNATKIHKQQSQLISQAYKIAQQARSTILKQHAWAKQVQKTRRDQIIFKREQLAREKQQRKSMKGEQTYMKDFLERERVQKQKEEEQRKRAQQTEENGEAQPQEN